MLSKKYFNSVKNLNAIMKKIIEGTAPEKFTTEHLKKIGFPSSNDRALIGVMKDLGFLAESGAPTQRYHDYRNSSKSAVVLGDALKEAYSDIFHINENPTQGDRQAITGLFKSTHNVSDQVAGFMANTFLTLLNLADISGTNKTHKKEPEKKKEINKEEVAEEIPTKQQMNSNSSPNQFPIIPNLRYNIEIHLPATKDIEVYNSIFKSLKEHLLND
ncbi:DUF5343 domain-containing protein [Chryseobacterium chendengshani]|uniref:DUF5343 domain-containing protein n=1 Tax=Chryseobacterium sp. LJ756 TaxID=2864113 RepID=UPI001D470E54|nr:DUF5343 domain-containing protein [Chryseobacterium sp. LJ756]MBW7676527.1 DUF5343 domain-containing protein [Chryseobacterium sp. LJ756]